MTFQVQFSAQAIEAICHRYHVREFSLFGSVLTKDFSRQSDVDVLVSFEKGTELTLADLADLREELKEVFGREVDLVEKEALRNPFRKRSILQSKQTIYAA